TPIGEMIEATADTSGARRAAAGTPRLELPVTIEHLAAAVRAASARVTASADRPADVQTIGLPAASGSELGALLRPIATPLVMSGMGAATSNLLSSMFRDAGFTPVLSGGSGAGAPASTEPLRPADPAGVSLVGGDRET